MSAATVIHIQELCDQIVDFLVTSSDLRSSALISESFAVAVRPRIFGDVAVPTPDKIACKRFFLAMKTSPHLGSLIRRVHVGLEQSVLARLSVLHIPNLQEVSLRGNPKRRFTAHLAAIRTAATLLCLPTIRHVSLTYLCFRNMYDLDQLFEKCTSELHSLSLDTVSVLSHGGVPVSPRRIRPKSLCIRDPASASQSASAWHTSHRFQWLCRPMCPFDLTGLHDIDYDGTGMFYRDSELLLSSRSTLRSVAICRWILHCALWLAIDSSFLMHRSATSFGDVHSEAPRITLGDLPALTHLTMDTTPAYMHTKLDSVAAVLRSNSLLHLVVNVRSTASSMPGSDIWGALTCLMATVTRAAFPGLRSIELNMAPELFESSVLWGEVEKNVQATLADWDIIDKLRIAWL
ncbi:hypothetical protein DFH06DRAFT_1194040, partial [Mycena polygramma]